MAPIVLRANPTPEDDSWSFTAPLNLLRKPNANAIFGKFIKFTPQAISLSMERFPSNRILHGDDPSKFILLSFADFRFPDTSPRISSEYIQRMFKAGLYINNVCYRFYHHSNSQLRGRSCFVREASADAELDSRIYQLGDFGRILNVAKRAKRIGLLFSAAPIDYQLDPRHTDDIPDIKVGDEIMSDGCGLLSKRLAIQLSKAKQIIFRGVRYTPCVFQIRYLGYKGVVMLHPSLDEGKKHLVQFRQSMKKFSTTKDTTFSVVEFSHPYSFGRLNNDIIVLLSSLGVTNDKLLMKQEEYLQWIAGASRDIVQAIDFLSCLDQYPLAERVLLDGLDDSKIAQKVRSLQMSEIANFRKNDKPRTRTIVKKSRLLFGVCDPFQVLKEGQVHIRVTTSRKGPSTPIHGDVLIVRNPCLYPGDCLKLRAVHHPRLSHLVDCIVFATVARPGHHSAPSMSSGGDLDGDKFFVCWDPDIIPSTIAEPYDYPPNKEHVNKTVTREDLANYFAMYNNSGVAKVSALHQKWVRSSPQGALSKECQELNALHSQSVDGARIKIPDRLLTPPESKEPYIVDLLAVAASEFATRFIQSTLSESITQISSTSEAKELISHLLQSNQNALSEYELFNLAHKLSRQHSIDMRPYLLHVDFGALSTSQRYAISSALNLTPEDDAFIWNSLMRSDILTSRDLEERQLNKRWSMQRLYSSKEVGLTTFFEYLKMATQEFTRKLLILKTDDRFAVGIFIRGTVPWDEDAEVNSDIVETNSTSKSATAEDESNKLSERLNVVVCSFMPQTSASMSTYIPCPKGYRLHCSENNIQLYNKNRADTFIFVNRPPGNSGAQVATSIALQKISTRVQRQIGRINRTPVTAVELHVVSNRDRMAHQLFDMWFEHVPTEAYVKRMAQEILPYRLNLLQNVDWSQHPDWMKKLFEGRRSLDTTRDILSNKTAQEVDGVMRFCLEYHAEDELFRVFSVLIQQTPFPNGAVLRWMDQFPPLVFGLLHAFPPDDTCSLPEQTMRLAYSIVQNIIRTANSYGMASLAKLEKMAASIAQIPLEKYFDLLMLAALCIRSPNVVQEVLLVLNECRAAAIARSAAQAYAHKHGLAVIFDRAEEAASECPCDDSGKPRRQRSAPIVVPLFPLADGSNMVKAHVRVDSRTSVRLHSHVRLQAASKPEKGWIDVPVLDGVVVEASRGEMKIELLYPPPPEISQIQWKMHSAGSVATSKAMMDAILKLVDEGAAACRFHDIITGASGRVATDELVTSKPESESESEQKEITNLNSSQLAAVESYDAPLSLIWGPPGTGKTTVVVQIIRRLLRKSRESKVLVTASTHNAVDNVLERFVELNKQENLLNDEHILRAATDHSKVSKVMQSYTVDARLGGDATQNNHLARQAQQRVKSAGIVFTTCAGAGLGLLRKVDFDVVIIDEGSQITEACALIPLVKGSLRAIIVGDHVQLRPMVYPMGKILQYDISLLERLYVLKGNEARIRRTMLNVQYRFPKALGEFPSREFYEGNLHAGISNGDELLEVLASSTFPWPRDSGVIIPTVFIQCDAEEDMGGASKSNEGQAEMITRIVSKLTTLSAGTENTPALQITVLSPYAKQIQLLKSVLPGSCPCSTIDSFQGRESEIIIFSTVRCNVTGDIGFVEDARRLNVMWTRAKLGLIIVGDKRTMSATSDLWKRAIESCREVTLENV